MNYVNHVRNLDAENKRNDTIIKSKKLREKTQMLKQNLKYQYELSF